MSEQSEMREIHAPVELVIDPNPDNDKDVTLLFGPMSFEDLLAMLQHLGSAAGQRDFLEKLEAAFEAKLAERGASGE